MARRSSILLALLLAGFVLGVTGLAGWLLASGTHGGGLASAPEEEPALPSVERAAEVSVPAPRESTASRPTAVAPGFAPRERIDAADAELTDALWVEGRVEFPPGTPVGERVVIEAKGRSFERGGAHRVEPRADGTFRAAFSKKTRTGWLVVHGEHLYLDKPFRVKPAAPPDELVLAARLGGRIEGRLVADLPLDERQLLVGAGVLLTGLPQDDRFLDDFDLERTAPLAEDLSFSFGGLPPKFLYYVELEAGVVTPVEVDELVVRPGETTTVLLEPKLGATVSGRVLDEEGRPVEYADLLSFTAEVGVVDRHGIVNGDPNEEIEVDQQGRFTGRGVPPGEVSLAAKSRGRRGQRVDLGVLADGERRDGVEIVLAAGGTIAGVVRWPDGEPVSEARVTVTQAPRQPQPGAPFRIWPHYLDDVEIEVETGLDGAFRFTGLGPGSPDLTVSAIVPDERGRRRLSGQSWNVTLENVALGSQDLEVILSAGIVLTGRVTDDLGVPLDDFTVQVMPRNANRGFFIGGPGWFDEDEGLATRYRDAGGRFALEGLEPGRWQVRALAAGHLACVPVELELPGDGAGLALALNRTPMVSGIVVDPAGNPVAQASVVANDARASEWERVMSQYGGRTDEHGAFTLRRAPVGSIELQARSDQSAPSEVLTLELEPGQHAAGLRLVLRKGGRIFGTLVSSDGDTVAGRRIELAGEPVGPLGRSTRTDLEGAFTFADLPPGRYALVGHPSTAMVQSLGEDGEESASVHAGVTLADGETAHVVLGAPPEHPVRVTGVVTRAGAGVVDADITVRPSIGARSLSARTDATGGYELTLDAPGEYEFGLRHQRTRLSHRETVPEVEAHTIDFELPASAVSGRVLGPNGKPLNRISVELSATLQTAQSRAFGVSAFGRTDQGGNFRFEGVAPGDYLVTAGEVWTAASESTYGSAQVDVAVAEGEETEGVELRLDQVAYITGTVRDQQGRPVSGAAIYVRGEGGAVLSHWPTETDGAGRFETRGLNGGTWTVSARRGAAASAESPPVHLASGGTGEVELELGPATLLVLRVHDAAGQPVGAGLLVTDAAGRQYAGLRVATDAALYDRHDDRAMVVGPLPPGVYRVVAFNHDDVRAERVVELSGEPEREVLVTLGDED